MYTHKLFGKRLRELRRRKMWTQDDLAQEIEGSVNAISNWENGKAYPELEAVCRICNVFGVSPEEMLKGEEG